MSKDRPRLAAMGNIFLLLAVAILATLPGWAPKRVFVPTDSLEMFAPWAKAGENFRPRNEVLLDQTVQFVPWMKYAVSRIGHRDEAKKWSPQIPLWNPYQQLGVPFLANGQSAVFFPTTWLHVLLRPEWSWTISAVLRLWFAGLGVWLLARRYGVSPSGSVLAGVAFMLCGFNVVWLNHPHTNVMVMLPWTVLVLQRLIERPGFIRIGVAAIVFGIQFLGGHPASCAHLLFICGIIYLLHLIWISPRKALVAAPLAAFAVGLGFALAGAQWLPLMEYVHSSAASAYREAHAAGGFHPQLLAGILFPYANGFPPDRVGPYRMDFATGLPNTNELAGGFVGTIPLLLAVLALFWQRRRRMVIAWCIVGLVSMLVAIGLPGVGWIVQRTPVLRLLQNGRLIVGAALALAILSGFGFDALLERVREGIAVRRLLLTLKFLAIGVGAVAVLLAAGLLIARGPIVRAGEREVDKAYQRESLGHEHTQEYSHALVKRIHTELVYTSMRLLIPAAVLGAAWLLLHRRYAAGRAAAGSAWPWIGLAGLELLAFAVPYNFGSPAASYLPATAATDFIKAKQREFKGNPYRMAATFRAMHPDLATGYGLFDTRGYDAVTPARYREWMLRMDDQNADEMQSDVKRLVHPERPAFSILGLRYVMTEVDHPIVADGWTQVDLPSAANSGSAAIFEKENALPRAWIVPLAEWHDSAAEARERVASGEVDPRQVVILDREMSAYDTEMSESVDRQRVAMKQPAVLTTQAVAPGVKVEAKNNKIEFLEDSPEKIRIRITDCTPGWLVLADTYSEGWQVKEASDDPLKGKDYHDMERYAVPAYGIVRAIPLAMSSKAAVVGVTLEYHPRGWKYGLFTSAGGGVVLLLIFAAALLSPARRAVSPIGES